MKTTLKNLWEGKVVEIEGFLVKKIPGQIKIGDLYAAERNTGPHLLHARQITYGVDHKGNIMKDVINIVHPEEIGHYSFDGRECIKVEIIDVV